MAACSGTGLPGLGGPRLEHNGQLSWAGRTWNADREGFPPEVETELIIAAGGHFRGRFLMTPTERSRPGLTQRLVAVALADQVGSAIGEYDPAEV